MLQIARQIHRFRGLLWTLTVRELKARYRGSALGYVWSLANPLMLLGVYTLVFGFIFNPRVAVTEPYSLFLISGLFPWIWISTSILEGTMSLVANAGLIRKAAFPAELLPTVSVLSNLVHFALALPILAGAVLVGRALGYPVGGVGFLLLPAVVALQIPLVGGLALGLAALNVHFKDVRDLTNNLLTLTFFLTPIIYALESIQIRPLRLLIRYNPFTPFALAYQAVIFHGRAPAWPVWLQMILMSLLFYAAGVWIFERLRETLVEAA